MRRWLTRSALVLLSGVVLSSCSDNSLLPTTEKTPVPQAALMAGPTTIRISQIYGGGGSTSTNPVPAYKYDYVELFNYGQQDVDISGWRLQYASSAGNFSATASQNVVFPANTTIPAGKYFLIRLGSASNFTGADITVFDGSGTTAMAAGAGKLILTTSATAFTTSCPDDATIIDKVGYGSYSCSPVNANWTATTPTISTTLAAFRQQAGCSTSNAFVTGTPAPRSLASGSNVCNVTVAGVIITAPPTSINLNTPTTFTADVRDAQGNLLQITPTWSATPNLGSFKGATYTATQSGTIQVTATAGGVSSAPATVVINAPVVASVDVTPTEATIFQNKTQQFTAVAKDAGGATIAGQTFTWSIAPASGQATTTSGGLVTGTQVGDVTVQATSSNGKVGIATLHILTPPPPAPELVISEIMANPPLSNTDADKEWIEIYNPGTSAVSLLNWKVLSLEQGNVASHTITQNVTIPAKGVILMGPNANQTANGGLNIAYQWSGITLSNSTTTDFIELQDANGQTSDRVDYTNYTPADGVARAVIDASADNSSIINSNWEDVGLGTPGVADYGDRGPVAFVSLSANPAYVGIGSNRQVSASLSDANGKSVRSPLTWSSLNAGIASVDANGLVHGNAAGDATIQAISSNGTVGTMVIHVLAPGTAAYIEISLDNSVPLGFSKRAFYTLKDANGADVAGSATWATGDDQIATIDAKGYITTKRTGAVQIIATSGVATGSKTYTILPASVPTTAVYRNHTEFGKPVDNDSTNDFIISRTQFKSSWNPNRGQPNWVSWNLNGSQFGNAFRCNCFTPDPLATGYQTHDSTYVGSGYSRGHMVQSESRTSTDQENAATFFLSNIIPQIQASNGGPWLSFETYLNSVAQSGKEVYIVAGGEFGPNPLTLNNKGFVPIPDYAWKVAIIVPAGTGLSGVVKESDLQVLAVRMPNLSPTDAAARGIPGPTAFGGGWEGYQTTVDNIEAHTGYDVFSLLSDKIEIAVESGTHAPVAGSTVPSLANVNESVSFSGATSTDADANQALTYAWSFGDNTNGTGKDVTHTYATAGNFSVRLIVTDPLGIADTTTKSIHIKDTTAPIVTPTVVGTVGSNEWYTSDVHITWTTTDAESGIASSTGCSNVDVANDTNGTTFTCVARNGDGLETTKSVSIKRDASAPDLNANIVGTSGKAGWYTSDVTVSWTAGDATSGIISPECVATDVKQDTNGQTLTCTVTNGAGLTTTKTVTIKRDTKAPTVTPTVGGTVQNGWYVTDVTVKWAVADATSGVSSQPCADASQTTDTNGVTFTCVAEDAAGLTTTESVTIKRDASAPDLNANIAGTSGKAGWYTSDVAVSWTAVDANSGIIGPECVATDVKQDTDGQVVSCTATNGAGLATTKTVTIKRDTSAPTVTPTIEGTLRNGWYVSNATVKWAAADATSGIASQPCADASQTTDTNSVTFTCVAENAAGLSTTESVTLKRDATAPTAAIVLGGTAGTNGWFTSNVAVNWNTGDALSGVASKSGCDAASVDADNAAATFTCVVTDAAGNQWTQKETVKRDASKPLIAETVTGTLGQNGWYVSNVNVSFATSDPTSGIASTNGCSTVVVSSDNTTAAFDCSATNGAGLSDNKAFTLKRDASLPVVTFTGNAGTYTVADSVKISCSAADVGPSGLASSTCANVAKAAYEFALGSNTLSASAKDNAGNTGNGSSSFTVTVGVQSLSELVTRWSKNAGQANSLNVKLANGSYNAFINEVEAQRGKAFTNAQADTLIKLVKAL